MTDLSVAVVRAEFVQALLEFGQYAQGVCGMYGPMTTCHEGKKISPTWKYVLVPCLVLPAVKCRFKGAVGLVRLCLF
jgi:hypothetical protein